MTSNNLQAKYLATSAVSLNVLGLFSAANHVHDPQNRFTRRQVLSYTQWTCEDYIGQLHVSKVELTQAHKDIMETLFTNFPIQNLSIVKDMPEHIIQFSFDQLLRKLGKESNPNNYCWLLNALDDLRSVSITLTLVDARENSKGKVYFEAEEFSVLNSIKIGGETFPFLKRNETTETYLSKCTSFVNCELNFSRQFSNLLRKDMLLEYGELVPKIVELPKGFMKALVRHCYGHEWKKGAAFDELLKKYLQFHHDASSRTLQKELCNARKFFKPNEDGIPSQWTTHFYDVFGIELYWENKKLFIKWSKEKLDEKNKMENKKIQVRRIGQWEGPMQLTDGAYKNKPKRRELIQLKKRPKTKKLIADVRSISELQAELLLVEEDYQLFKNEVKNAFKAEGRSTMNIQENNKANEFERYIINAKKQINC